MVLTLDYRTSDNSPSVEKHNRCCASDQNDNFEIIAQRNSQDVYQPPAMSSEAVLPLSMFITEEHEGRLVGLYTQRERIHKIRRYKRRINHWKIENKNGCNGRSKVAKTKLRYFGRFIKKEDLSDLIISDEQIIQNNKIIEEATKKENYNKLVDLITQSPSEIH